MQAAKGILLYSPSLPCLFRGSLLYHEEIKAIGIRKYTACISVVSNYFVLGKVTSTQLHDHACLHGRPVWTSL